MKTNLDSRVDTTQFVLPENLNQRGYMHGGEIMKLMDNVAGLVFIKHCAGDAVTAAVKEVKMIKPIPGKSVVRCMGEVISTGRTSMTVKVCIWTQDIVNNTEELVTEGIFIGVGVDENSRPMEVPKVKYIED